MNRRNSWDLKSNSKNKQDFSAILAEEIQYLKQVKRNLARNLFNQYFCNVDCKLKHAGCLQRCEGWNRVILCSWISHNYLTQKIKYFIMYLKQKLNSEFKSLLHKAWHSSSIIRCKTIQFHKTGNGKDKSFTCRRPSIFHW